MPNGSISITGIILDLYDTPYPRLFSKYSGNLKYKHRLIWCSLPHIKRQPFFAYELVLIIEQAYGEKVHTFSVAAFLKKLATLGYVERIPLISNSAQYQYRLTQLYRNYWKEATQ